MQIGADCHSLKLPPQDDFQKRFPPPWRLCMWLGSALAPGPGGLPLPKACRRGACEGHTAEDSQAPRMLLPSGQGPGPGVGGCLVAQSCPTLATPWTVACQAPLSMGFCRQEYWRGLPFPSPRGSSRPRNRTQGSCTAGRLYHSGYDGSKGTGHLPNSKPRPTQLCIFYLKKWLEELAG